MVASPVMPEPDAALSHTVARRVRPLVPVRPIVSPVYSRYASSFITVSVPTLFVTA